MEKRDLRRNQNWWHLDLGTLASRRVRRWISVVWAPQSVVLCCYSPISSTRSNLPGNHVEVDKDTFRHIGIHKKAFIMHPFSGSSPLKWRKKVKIRKCSRTARCSAGGMPSTGRAAGRHLHTDRSGGTPAVIESGRWRDARQLQAAGQTVGSAGKEGWMGQPAGGAFTQMPPWRLYIGLVGGTPAALGESWGVWSRRR